jgi:hypothetical protein
MTTPPYFTDAEVDEMCDGLTQDAAKVRFLRRLGLRVDRKPNGKPLAWRAAETGQNEAKEPSIAAAVQAWAATRQVRHGQKTQGR